MGRIRNEPASTQARTTRAVDRTATRRFLSTCQYCCRSTRSSAKVGGAGRTGGEMAPGRSGVPMSLYYAVSAGPRPGAAPGTLLEEPLRHHHDVTLGQDGVRVLAGDDPAQVELDHGLMAGLG